MHVPIPHVRNLMPMFVAKYHKKKGDAYKSKDKVERVLSKLR